MTGVRVNLYGASPEAGQGILTGLSVHRSNLMRPRQVILSQASGQLFVGPKPLAPEVWEAFHQGAMLDWYEYIGEGPGSAVELLFGYGPGSLR